MAQGPLEYYVIGFDGHRFSGEIAPAIEDAVASGVVRVVDLDRGEEAGHRTRRKNMLQFDCFFRRVELCEAAAQYARRAHHQNRRAG